MKTLFALSAVCLTVFSCSKDDNKKKDGFTNVCFQAKYVGRGCSDIIQLIGPVANGFETSKWFKGNTQDGKPIYISNAIEISDLPNEYKTGDTFYFKAKDIVNTTTFARNTECVGTKFHIEADQLSMESCGPGSSN